MEKSEKLREYLEKVELDGVFIHNPANIFYYSNFKGTNGYLLMTKEQNYLLTDFRYIDQANQQALDFEVIEINEESSIESIVNRLRRKHKLYKLGLEGDFISRNMWLGYERVLTSRLIDVNIDHIRQVKSDYEVEVIKDSIKIAEKAFLETLDNIKVGMSEKEVARALEFTMLDLGAEAIAFDTIVASGVRGALPHGIASDKKIENGELVTIDFGCIYKGYCSDITRTFAIGKVDEKLLDIYEIVLQANKLGIESLKANVTGGSIDKIVRDFISDKGYGENFGHGLGHSFGIEIHEDPRLRTNSEEILTSGNIVTVEPGIYVSGLGGVRIEDDVLIKDNKVEVLTSLNKELIVLEEEI